MFSVKFIKPLEDLIFESNIIKVNSELATIFNRKTKDGKVDWSQIDMLLDKLIDQGILDIDKELAEPLFARELSDSFIKSQIQEYLKYCKIELAKVVQELNSKFGQDFVIQSDLEPLVYKQTRIAARIEALEKLYAALKLTNDENVIKASTDILNQINSLKQEVLASYYSFIENLANRVKNNITIIENPKAEESEKVNSAEDIFNTFEEVDNIIMIYPQTIKDGVKQAKNKAKQTTKQALGSAVYNGIEQQTLSNKQEAAILHRILSMKYMHFYNVDDVYKEADKIKQQINGLRGVRSKTSKYNTQSTNEVIEFLTNELAQVTDDLIKRITDKSFDLDKAKGIHFKFNTKLKLYELTDLPVTGEQIAEAHIVMKLRKALYSYITTLFGGGTTDMSAAGQAWANFGSTTHNIYAKTLNKSAKFIGKVFGGREGEIRADAISRLFIPGPKVLDKSNNSNNNYGRLYEEGTAPGLTIQAPGSISNMGDIYAPTENSFGSGDRFGTKSITKYKTKTNKAKRKRKTKKKSIYEEYRIINNFSDFINNRPFRL